MTPSLRFTIPQNVKKRKDKVLVKHIADKNRLPLDIYVYRWFSSVPGVWIQVLYIMLKVLFT